MTTRDLLDKAIDACEKLKDVEYRIVVGKNNVETEILLSFPVNRFSHMMGFHKLKDINYLNCDERNKERIYEAVLSNRWGLRDKISGSAFIESIVPRFRAVGRLEDYLDHNEEVYYSKPNYFNHFSHIAYDFALHVIDEGNCVSFYFIRETEINGLAKYVVVSAFENEMPQGPCRRPYTLLKKGKINKITGATTLLYDYNKNTPSKP